MDTKITILELSKKGMTQSAIAKTLKVNRMLVWRTIKRFQETGKLKNRPGQGRPKTATTPALVKSTREKVRRNSKKSIRKLAKEVNVSVGSMSNILHKELKMLHYKHQKRQLLSASSVDKRLARSKILLRRLEGGTLPNLVFSDEKKFDVQQKFNVQNDRIWSKDGSSEHRMVTRSQGAASVMVWAAVTESGRSPLVFVEPGVKINKNNYVSDILEAELLPWATDHFRKKPWSFQQDSAPSHGAKFTQDWLKSHVPHFISKEEWPPSSPDLNPLDFGIWAVLENKVSASPCKNLESLKAKLRSEWDKIPQSIIRASCKSFSERLRQVVDAKGGHIE